LRQTDVYNNVFIKNNRESLSKQEKAEFFFLYDKVHKEGYDKKHPTDEKQLFNDEYRRYLELSTKRQDRKRDISVNGHMDMILYSMIHADEDNVLYETMLKVFKG
jgi:hypothetical protein